MTITLNITSDLKAELARQAAVQGRALESYAASLLEEAAHLPASAGDQLALDKQRAQAAAARIRDLPKGVTLGNLTLRELIDEGRP